MLVPYQPLLGLSVISTTMGLRTRRPKASVTHTRSLDFGQRPPREIYTHGLLSDIPTTVQHILCLHLNYPDTHPPTAPVLHSYYSL